MYVHSMRQKAGMGERVDMEKLEAGEMVIVSSEERLVRKSIPTRRFQGLLKVFLLDLTRTGGELYCFA